MSEVITLDIPVSPAHDLVEYEIANAFSNDEIFDVMNEVLRLYVEAANNDGFKTPVGVRSALTMMQYIHRAAETLVREEFVLTFHDPSEVATAKTRSACA